MLRCKGPTLALAGVVLMLVLCIGPAVQGKSAHDAASPMADLEAALARERQVAFKQIAAAAVQDPSAWTFVWLDQRNSLMSGQLNGIDAVSAEAFLRAWVRESWTYHRVGDYMPLLAVSNDGGDIRIGIRRADGSIDTLVMAPTLRGDRVEWEVVQR